MSKIQKFFSYLGFNDNCINAEQLLVLIQLLSYEQDVVISNKTIVDIMDFILDIYIDKMETNTFININEQQIIEALANC